MTQGLLVVLGLAVGFVFNEINHVLRRREQLEDREHADKVERERWHRGAKQEAYGRLAMAVHKLRATYMSCAIAQTRAPAYTDEQAAAAQRGFGSASAELQDAVAATAVVVSVDILQRIETLATRLSAMTVANIVDTDMSSAPGRLIPQFDALTRDADELLAELRGDLLGLSSEQVAADVQTLATKRSEEATSSDVIIEEALRNFAG